MPDSVYAMRLPSGRNVLATIGKYGMRPYTFANTTQARKRLEDLQARGIVCHITPGHPKYIVITLASVPLRIGD